MDKENDIRRLEREIEACDCSIGYYKLSLKTVKDSKKKYQDKIRAVKARKKICTK